MNPQPQVRKPKANVPSAHPGTPDLSNYLFGRVQPQALPLEEAVLGALMLDKDALSVVMEVLKPESFYLESHALIYRACLDLFNASRPVDLLTVTEQLRGRGELEKIGGAYCLVELTNRVASAANVEYHAHIIRERALKRGIIRLASDALREAYEDTVDGVSLLEAHERSVFELGQGRTGETAQGIGRVAVSVVRGLEEASKSESGLIGVPSGLVDLDRWTGGWRKSDLIIIAARPGMGKTASVLTMAQNAAKEFNRAVGIFSLEMSKEQLVGRIIAGEAAVDGRAMNAGRLEDAEWQAVQAAVERLDRVPLFIDDTPGLTIFELRARARRMRQRHGIQLLIVDYLQLMTNREDRNGNREQEIAGIARGLKNLAKELDIPVIALSQLSRAVETRGGSKRPMLSDLRESGEIEQAADLVCFLYRPEYYQILEDEAGQSLKGKAEFIIAKYRNGPANQTVMLRYLDYCARFTDIDAPPPPMRARASQFPTAEHDKGMPIYHPAAGIPRLSEEEMPF